MYEWPLPLRPEPFTTGDRLRSGLDRGTLGSGFLLNLSETLLENLRHHIGDQMVFRISSVERIDRTEAGKFRSVISKVDPRSVAESRKPIQGTEEK